jgi:NADH-quinone oxidoreductase subunit G
MGTFAETSGTWVSLEGLWQSQAGAARPLGDARPGWKVLRVLGNLLDVAGFDYQSSEQVRDELRALVDSAPPLVPGSSYVPAPPAHVPGGSVADVPMYRTDAVLRRSAPLQASAIGRRPAASW